EYQATGRPVGSRSLVDSGAVPASPSTVRAELNTLEELGYLTHPHTSAGRIPTDLGYRTYVDELVADEDLPARRPTLGLDAAALASHARAPGPRDLRARRGAHRGPRRCLAAPAQPPWQ